MIEATSTCKHCKEKQQVTLKHERTTNTNVQIRLEFETCGHVYKKQFSFKQWASLQSLAQQNSY